MYHMNSGRVGRDIIVLLLVYYCIPHYLFSTYFFTKVFSNIFVYISFFTFMSWLWIYCFPHHSIALVVDSPQFFNRLAESFITRINPRFIVLLWGDKSCIDSQSVKDMPLYSYKDITKLGRESRNALFLSGQQGTSCVIP
jgi:hypothetical protein